MKIVQIITELRPGGAERIVAELSKYLANKSHCVDVICLLPQKESVITLELQQSKIRIFSLQLRKWNLWRIFSLRKMLQELNPDVVHAHLLHPNILSRLFSKKYKLINTVHTAEKRRNKRWYFIFDRLTYFRCDCMTVVSKAVQQFHSHKLKVSPKELPVVYNGIVTPEILSQEKKNQLKKEWGTSHCHKIIGSIGRLSFEKGYDLLWDLLPTIHSFIPKEETWGIIIIGEGNERKFLEKKIGMYKRLHIHLPGFRVDASSCISAFDVFVMPSRYEGFGLTLAEAMAQGIPIVTSNVPSLIELASEYGNATIADFTNIETAQTIVKKAYYNYQKPHLKFSLEEMVTKYLQIYKEK